jgi:hypothetical protein
MHSLVAPTYARGSYKVEPVYESAFEIDERVFLTDQPMLDWLNQMRDHGKFKAMQLNFALALATGRIKRLV